jgi:hypothetical protein
MPNIKINLSEKYLYNKKYILKWRENHREEYNDIQKYHQKKYDNWKRVQKIYLRILLE